VPLVAALTVLGVGAAGSPALAVGGLLAPQDPLIGLLTGEPPLTTGGFTGVDPLAPEPAVDLAATDAILATAVLPDGLDGEGGGQDVFSAALNVAAGTEGLEVANLFDPAADAGLEGDLGLLSHIEVPAAGTWTFDGEFASSEYLDGFVAPPTEPSLEPGPPAIGSPPDWDFLAGAPGGTLDALVVDPLAIDPPAPGAEYPIAGPTLLASGGLADVGGALGTVPGLPTLPQPGGPGLATGEPGSYDVAQVGALVRLGTKVLRHPRTRTLLKGACTSALVSTMTVLPSPNQLKGKIEPYTPDSSVASALEKRRKQEEQMRRAIAQRHVKRVCGR